MPSQSWVQALAAAGTAGPTLTAAAAASALPTDAVYTLPANSLKVGSMFRFIVAGRMSNAVTTPGNWTFDFRMGPTSNIIVYNFGVVLISTTAHTTLPFYWEGILTCRAIGSGTLATLMGATVLIGQSPSVTAVADAQTTTRDVLNAPAVTPVVGTGFDSTVANQMNIFVTPSLATASITFEQYVLESLN